MFALVTQLSVTFSLPLTTDYVIARKLTLISTEFVKKFARVVERALCVNDLSVKNGKALVENAFVELRSCPWIRLFYLAYILILY